MSYRKVSWVLVLGPDGDGVTRRFWSGVGDLSFDGQSHVSIDGLGVSDIMFDGSPPEVTVTLPVLPEARADWIGWSGEVPGMFRYLRYDGSWKPLGPRIVGMIADPQFRSGDGVEAVELTIRAGARHRRPAARTWSAEAQPARFTGDVGFDLLRESVTVRGRWPN